MGFSALGELFDDPPHILGGTNKLGDLTCGI
jgi:hypothetical protein